MIEVRNLGIEAGEFTLRNISFTVPSGSHAVLMGRTGCGKTTILEAIAGLRKVQEGTISIGGHDVTAVAPAMRAVGYVPQDLALFPHLSVAQNIGFALEVRGMKDALERTLEIANWLGISPLLDRSPSHLSGGEAQRVALGRAIAANPKVLLLDEPLSALDDATREEMRAVLRAVRERTRVTMLHVTHHRDDARALADVFLELRDGTVVTA